MYTDSEQKTEQNNLINTELQANRNVQNSVQLYIFKIK